MEKINHVLTYLQENYQKEIRVKEMAQLVGVTENYFSKYFYKYTRSTFISYRNGLKIDKACELLVKTNDTVESICFDCGFSSPSYFFSQFKKRKKCSPNVYRMKFLLDI